MQAQRRSNEVLLASWLYGVWRIRWNIHPGGGVEGVISWFSSQLHLPEIRRSFCPYVVLLGSVMAQGPGG